MNDRARGLHDPAETPPPDEIPFARNLTTCVLDFVRDRATHPQWVT